LTYTEDPVDQGDISAALKIVEETLDHINETIRDNEGTEKLRAISQHLWIGQG
jgi:actin cytoskeleton-regulatory complex protein PAN1